MNELDQATGDARWPVVVATAGVVMVAGVAAVVSYEHMREVAEVAGEEWRSVLLPLSVDGMIIAATLNAWQAKRNRQDVPAMTKVAIAVGLVVSVAANVAVPFLPVLAGGLLSALVAAWPPIALAIAFEELLSIRRQSGVGAARERQDETDRAAAEPSPDQRFAAGVPVDAADRAAGNVGLPERAGDLAADDGMAARLPEDVAGPAEESMSKPELKPVSDPRESARELARQEPEHWTGKALGEKFGRSARWGRDQLAAVRQERADLAKPQLVSVQN